jgi:hypothetical protein
VATTSSSGTHSSGSLKQELLLEPNIRYYWNVRVVVVKKTVVKHEHTLESDMKREGAGTSYDLLW